MIVKKLPNNIQSLFCTSIHLISYKRAVEELIFNALDAKASSIAIRIHIQQNKIQVVDNGCGIYRNDFDLLGQKYATSKFCDLSTFQSAPNFYGFRGQAIASLVEVSKCVKITSRVSHTEKTWSKEFLKGKQKAITETSTRPSKGTTVEVDGFLYNLNIQSKAINPINELTDIKTFLEQLSLVHIQVSFSLRDDSSNEIVFKIHKNRDIYQTFKSLYDLEKSNIQELQVEKHEYKAIAYIAKCNDSSTRHRWLFLNKRLVNNPKFSKIMHDCMKKTIPNTRNNKIKYKNIDTETECDTIKNKLPFYFVFINCPYYDYEISNTPKQSRLEFKDWTQIKKLIEKLVQFYSGNLKLKEITQKNCNDIDTDQINRKKVKEIIDKILGSNPRKIEVSQLQNGKKGKLIKRKKKSNLEMSLSKVLPLKTTIRSIEINPYFNNNNANNKNIKTITPLITKARHNILRSVPSQNIIQKNNVKNIKTNINPSKFKHQKNHNKTNILKKPCKKDALIKAFEEQSDTVIKRCKLLAQKVKDRQKCKHRKQTVIINKTVNYSSIVQNNNYKYSIRKRVGEVTIHDYIPLKVTKRNDIYEKNAVYKTSHDLIKTMIGSYKTPSRAKNCLNNKKSLNRISCDNTNPSVQTYRSHQYNSNHIYKNSEGRNHQTIRDQYLIKNMKIYSKNTQSTHLQSYDMNNREQTENFSTNKNHLKPNPDRFLNFLYTQGLTSYSIDFSDSLKDPKTNLSLKDPKRNYNKSDSVVNHENFFDVNDIEIFPTQSVYSNAELTYTFQDSNILSVQRFKKPTQYKNSVKNNRFGENLNISNSTVTNVEEQVKDLNIVFVSNSNSSINENSCRDYMEPLNVCEAIFQSREDSLDNNINKCLSNKEFAVSEYFSNTYCDATLHINYELRNSCSLDKEIFTNSSQILGTLSPMMSKDDDNGYKDHASNNFNLKNRLRFIPKGMSPIFRQVQARYTNELETERDFFNKQMYSNFIDNVLICSEIFEAHIQDHKEEALKALQNVSNKLKMKISALTFNAQSLRNTKVLGQVDRKFIAGIIQNNTSSPAHLVLFDQHAVHERISLEENLEEYYNDDKWKGIHVDNVVLKLSKDDILYLHNFKEKFSNFGLEWKILNNTEIAIYSIPAAIIGKHHRQVDKVIGAVKNLISEEIDVIKTQGGCISVYPKSIMDLVFSEACRYAVKFGDILSWNECVQLIKKLSFCKTPFQCAHGRPVMAVMLEVQTMTFTYKINMEKLCNWKNINK